MNHPSHNPDVTAIINALPPWQQELCGRVREVAHRADAEMQEVIKRGMPFFVLEGNVFAIMPAKAWVSLFLYSPYIDDPSGMINGGLDNKTTRMISLTQDADLDEAALIDIFRQIIANNRSGRRPKLTPEPQHEIVLSPFIRDALQQAGLQAAFDERPYYQRRHWPEWIEAAKQPATRERRLLSMIDELGSGEYMGQWRQ
jgi:hypothetical protein